MRIRHGGWDRIQGELRKLGVVVSDTTVENVLKSNGIEPQPTRKDGTSWSEFLAVHLDCLGAIDFTSVDVWTPKGLRTIYLLFAMQIATRKVPCLGSTEHPDKTWMLEAIDRATADDGIFSGEDHPTIVLMDRGSKFSEAFRAKLQTKDVKPHVLPPRSPNLNAHMERFIGPYKRELAQRMIFFGKSMLDKATVVFLEHYHGERPHQGLDNERIIKLEHPPPVEGEILVDKRLGGLLKSYRCVAEPFDCLTKLRKINLGVVHRCAVSRKADRFDQNRIILAPNIGPVLARKRRFCHVKNAAQCLADFLDTTSEKFWSAKGGDELLALRGDFVSDGDRLGKFLKQFTAPTDGTRAYATAA